MATSDIVMACGRRDFFWRPDSGLVELGRLALLLLSDSAEN